MAAEKTSPTMPNKSEFIRSQLAEMSAADVVAKAKADGLTIEPGLVYRVRSQVKARRKVKKGAAKRTAAKKTAAVKRSAATKPLPSKSDFIRRLPKLSPKEVVAKAKAEGIKLEVGYVYNVRSAGKAVAAKRAATTTTSRKATARSDSQPSVSTSTSSAEELLHAIAAEVGLGRAIEILAAERARVRAVIGGLSPARPARRVARVTIRATADRRRRAAKAPPSTSPTVRPQD
jgi:hypothetical protein